LREYIAPPEHEEQCQAEARPDQPATADAVQSGPETRAEPSAAAPEPAPAGQRMPPPAKFGAIDVGTNSVHLVMAEISPEGDFRILGRDKEMVQLGKGGFARHVLTQRAMQQGLAALQRFVKMANLKGITRLRAVATSAVREATNGGDFVRAVRNQLGLELHVIGVEEEARLIYLAVRHAVDLNAADNLVMDIGGGSLEMVVGNAERAEVLLSVKLGATRLAELFLHDDPPTDAELKALRRHVEEVLGPVIERIGPRKFARCIGTSGTVENIATVCAYRRGATEIEPVTQLRVTRGELKNVLADLGEMTSEQRRAVPGVDARRADSILPGVIVLLAVMQAFGISELEHCDLALREGVILDDIARHSAHLRARAMWPDPRARSVIYLGERCQHRQAHAEQVSRLAVSLFDQLRPIHQLSADYRELLKWACTLHDIGYLISHRSHHKHSYYLIRNGGLQGFSEPEIEVMANIARYHRKGRPKKSHYSWQNLPREHRRPVRKLVALARLANALDRTHDCVVDSVTCRVRRSNLELLVHARKDAELEMWTARRQARLFEREFGLPVRIVLAEPAREEAPDGQQP
jgi:exopolyphosphatase/guanosine-5'-triphosphate,3'-diphosphate pyrophosphatase